MEYLEPNFSVEDPMDAKAYGVLLVENFAVFYKNLLKSTIYEIIEQVAQGIGGRIFPSHEINKFER